MGRGEQKRGHYYPDISHFYDDIYYDESKADYMPKARQMLQGTSSKRKRRAAHAMPGITDSCFIVHVAGFRLSLGV